MSSLDRGLDLVDLLAERGDTKLAEAAAELKTSRATAFRLLTVLKERGYVQHDRAAKTYRLGPAIRRLAERSDVSSVVRIAGPAMAELRRMTGETVNIAVVKGNRITYAEIFPGRYPLRMLTEVGEEVPAHATAIGKAILAALPAKQRDIFLGAEPYTAFSARTITRRRDLDSELETTRARRYAVDDEEAAIQSACIGAEIVGGDGYPIAAISVSGLAARLKGPARPQIGRTIRQLCDEISAQLAPRPDRRLRA
jgi:DNA-binding IclR family transcriptional regulator